MTTTTTTYHAFGELYNFEVARLRARGQERARQDMREGDPAYEEVEIERGHARLRQWRADCAKARRQHRRLPARPDV